MLAVLSVKAHKEFQFQLVWFCPCPPLALFGYRVIDLKRQLQRHSKNEVIPIRNTEFNLALHRSPWLCLFLEAGVYPIHCLSLGYVQTFCLHLQIILKSSNGRYCCDRKFVTFIVSSLDASWFCVGFPFDNLSGLYRVRRRGHLRCSIGNGEDGTGCNCCIIYYTHSSHNIFVYNFFLLFHIHFK